MNIFVIWHDYDGHRREGYQQKMTKETEKSDPFNTDYTYAADCLKEAIDEEILEDIEKSAKRIKKASCSCDKNSAILKSLSAKDRENHADDIFEGWWCSIHGHCFK